jgi:transcription antitermination protein NusB
MKRADGVDLAARARARRRALQGAYAWDIGKGPMSRVIEQFEHEQEMDIADLEYFKDLLLGLEKNHVEIDRKLQPHLDREIAHVDAIERAVLRLAAYELLYRPDVPYRVVINEAIEVSKRFGAEFGHTYVNGVLDRAAVEWRAGEYRR